MNGKTKSFLEDTFITVIIILVISTIYYISSNYFFQETETETQNTQLIVNSNNTDTINIETIAEEKKSEEIIENIEEVKKIDTTSISIQKETPNTEEINKKKEKTVNLKKLKLFLDDIQEKISQNIVYSTDINTTQNNLLNIRITLLKSGEYEQLTFIDGDESTYEANKENIVKIFPLIIDEDIIEEFPRYIRIQLKPDNL